MWKSVNKTILELGIDRETLFKYRDDGTLSLGRHYRAFDNTYSRDSYRYNLREVKKTLSKKGLINA